MIIPCWEYLVLDVDPEEDGFEKELNRHGSDGWEVSGVFPEDGIIVFKRPSDGIKSYTGSGIRRKRPERRDNP